MIHGAYREEDSLLVIQCSIYSICPTQKRKQDKSVNKPLEYIFIFFGAAADSEHWVQSMKDSSFSMIY